MRSSLLKKTDSNKYIAFKSTAQQAADEKAAATAKQKLDAAVAAYTNAADKQAAQALVDQAQQEYNVAYKEAKFGYVEVAGKDEAMVLTSNTDGQFQISGLAAGTYKLEEIKAPEGFAKIDDVEFVVGAGSWNQGEFNYLKDVQKNDATKVVNKKITIPQTGGIGTIIFAVAGAAIMGIAVYAYVKNNKDEDQLA